MEIAILCLAGCPNLARAQARVREALARSGATASVRDISVNSGDAAAAAGMRAHRRSWSTGATPFRAAESMSLSCRLYATAGGVDGAPAVDQLVALLSP